MGLPSGWLLLELPMALRWVTLSAMQSVLPLATRLGWQTVPPKELPTAPRWA